jgi:hypothetical protein
MGEIWELVVPSSVKILRSTPVVESYKDLRVDLKSWNGADLVRSDGYGGILFTEFARKWFAERWNRYMIFDEFPVT